MSKQQFRKIIDYGIFPIILLCYPLRHINQGIDLTDTGYSLYNFEVFQETEATWWVISTYLANFIGFTLQQLPTGNTLFGMNLMTSLLVSATSLIAYFLLKEQIPAYIVFIGEVIAISLCWCPTVILYNYLTYFFVTLGIFFLYHGLIKDKIWCYILAGCMLGINVMVRFPNLVEASLILSVWYYGCLKRKKTIVIVRETGWCVLGYLIGFSLGFFLILIRFGITDFLNMLQELSELGSVSSGSEYSVLSMALIPFMLYLENIKWIIFMIIPTYLGILYFRVWKGKYNRINQALYIVGVIILFRWFYGKGLFNVQYQTYDAILRLGMLFIMLSFAFFAWCLVSKKVMKEQKLGASMAIILLIITPLGSNNNIYPILNNLFLIAPTIICMCYLLIRYSHINFAIQGMLAGFLILFLVQSILFGQAFVFRGSTEYSKRDTEVTLIPKLEGMYTDVVRANAIEELYEFLEVEEQLGSNLLTFGHLPALHYYFGMSTYLTSAWIDLDSYTDEMLESAVDSRSSADLEELVIIVDLDTADKIEEGYVEEQMNMQYKYSVIVALINGQQYKQQMKNELFAVYY